MTDRANRCGCGRMPVIRSKVLDDDVLTWVECQGCRRTGAEAIDSARNDAAAVANWNNGKGREW
ncbi:hypothetical protein K3M67_03075 [Sphingobium sp. V4]|uniref:hypothetical protein n=1 Tax=Sphingobium sp. V4 TaxID=3038927 RepID=UPI0025580914|nr:hypothetical protein [Sphingobium sp. V4]WIW88979.1 hypothetical protein K3M67_03075 [Sphingobium sp. V4]